MSDAQARKPNQFRLLGTRRFLPLFVVQFLGAFNDQIYQKAFVALITYRLADEVGVPLAMLGVIASALFILPFVLFTPTAGQLADRMDKAVLMRWVKASEIVVMCLAVVGYQTQNIYFLYFVLFLMGMQSSVFAPIKYAVLPQYLKPEELIGGNGLVQGFTFLAIIGGSIAGNELILTESGVIIVSVAVVAIAVIGFIASLFAPPAPPPFGAPDGKVDYFVPRAIWMLVSRCVEEARAFRVILAISWFWFLGATFLSLLPAYVKDALNADEGVLTVLMTGFSLGVAIGAIASEKLGGGEVSLRMPPYGAIGIAIVSVELWMATPLAVEGPLMDRAAFLASPSGWRITLDFVLLAICAGVYVTPLNAVLQATAPDAERGRFIACSNVMDAGAMVMSAALAAICVLIGLQVIDVLALFALSGLGIAVFIAMQAPETMFGGLVRAIWPKT